MLNTGRELTDQELVVLANLRRAVDTGDAETIAAAVNREMEPFQSPTGEEGWYGAAAGIQGGTFGEEHYPCVQIGGEDYCDYALKWRGYEASSVVVEDETGREVATGEDEAARWLLSCVCWLESRAGNFAD